MEFSAEMIAAFLGGIVDGNKDVKVTNVAKIEEATTGTLAFLSNPKYEEYIYTTGASIVMVNQDFVPKAPIASTLIRVLSAYEAFAKLLQLYVQNLPRKEGISEKSDISSSAKLGQHLYIGSFAFVGDNVEIGDDSQIYPQVFLGDNVKIGKNCKIYAGVKIYEGCVIGNNVIIHAGTVIGSDGFGFSPKSDGSGFEKIPQIGNVVISDDVEIGSNCSIDRATMGSTRIGRGVKLDNLEQVAHNVTIGENTVIAAQTGIAGSSKIGKNSMIGGQVGIVGHISLADGIQIAAQSGISSSIKEEGTTWLGSPAFPSKLQRQVIAVLRHLPELRYKLLELEKEFKESRK